MYLGWVLKKLTYKSLNIQEYTYFRGFPAGSELKNLPANARDVGLIPGSGRSPGEGNGHTLQYSCLGNPTDRGARRATTPGVAKESDTT